VTGEHPNTKEALTTEVNAVPAQGSLCEPYDDPRSHDFQGWVEFDEGRGGTTVCTRCGISSFSHSMRYAP
jgi:hypothetical protein